MSEAREPLAASKAARSVLFRASGAGLTVRQHRVLAAVIAYTALYDRRSDRVFLANLAAFAFGVERAVPWQMKRTAEALRTLHRYGLVESTPPRGRPPGANGPAYLIRLIEIDPDPGVTYEEETHPDHGVTSAKECTPIPVRNRPRSRSEIDPAPGGPTEEVPEETSEGGATHVLAKTLVSAAHGELPPLIQELETTHGATAVLAGLNRLADNSARFRWPSELSKALTAAMRPPPSTPSTVSTNAALLAAKPKCPRCSGDRHLLDDDGTARPCPDCAPGIRMPR